MLLAVVYDILREAVAYATHVAQKFAAGRIDIDTYGVHTGLHYLRKPRFKFHLVYVMLILPYSYTLRVNLHEFGEWVYESSGYGDSSAHGYVKVGKLIPRAL